MGGEEGIQIWAQTISVRAPMKRGVAFRSWARQASSTRRPTWYQRADLRRCDGLPSGFRVLREEGEMAGWRAGMGDVLLPAVPPRVIALPLEPFFCPPLCCVRGVLVVLPRVVDCGRAGVVLYAGAEFRPAAG